MLPASSEVAAVGQEYDGPLEASSSRPWLGVAPWGSVGLGLAGFGSRVGDPLPCLDVLSRRRSDLLPHFPVG